MPFQAICNVQIYFKCKMPNSTQYQDLSVDNKLQKYMISV